MLIDHLVDLGTTLRRILHILLRFIKLRQARSPRTLYSLMQVLMFLVLKLLIKVHLELITNSKSMINIRPFLILRKRIWINGELHQWVRLIPRKLRTNIIDSIQKQRFFLQMPRKSLPRTRDSRRKRKLRKSKMP